MSLAKRGIIVGILAWYAGWVSLPAQTADRNKLTTHFLALVGFPSQDLPAAAVPLVIPGKVVRLGAESGADESILEKTIFEAKVVERLWATFRLDTGRKLQRSLSVALEVNRQFDIPSLESAGVRMSATLLGFNEKIATYRIRFTSGEKALADSSVNVAIGKRAVVGDNYWQTESHCLDY